MAEFHPFTLAAAVRILENKYDTHDAVDTLVFSWGRDDLLSGSTIRRKLLDLARIAAKMKFTARTGSGEMSLARALVEEAVKVGPPRRDVDGAWTQFVAGLRFDEFEIEENQIETGTKNAIEFGKRRTSFSLRKMLPSGMPELDFREAESEIENLLKRHNFLVAKGHLEQAVNAFQRGDWAASNSQLRTFYEDILNAIAVCLGCGEERSGDAKRQYLADAESGPFLIHSCNEWENDRGRPAFILGLWARLQPGGSHPGLSNEDDATFRLQTVLITARLLMRRFDQRSKS